MQRIARSLFYVSLISFCSPSSLPAQDQKVPAGFEPLFNGRDLAGWRIEGGELQGGDLAAWTVEDGNIVALGRDYRSRSFLLTEREFTDFLVRLEFNLATRANSAIGIARRRGNGCLTCTSQTIISTIIP